MRWIKKKNVSEVKVGDIIRVDPNPNKGVSDGVLGNIAYQYKLAFVYRIDSEGKYWFKLQNSNNFWNGSEPKRYLFLDRSS